MCNLIYPRNARRRLLLRTVLLSLLVFFAVGCSSPPESVAPPRPVWVFQVGETAVFSPASFAGEIVPRRETTLAFRVAGKLAARLVDVGERVHKGQVLARLEPSDYQLATRNLKAQLAAARAESHLTHADLLRYQELLAQNVISAPEWERRQTADITARERVAALEAQFRQTGNQLGYAELLAERDGVITALTVEAGEVVAAGQSLGSLAQLDEQEVLIQIPEQRLAEILPGVAVFVTLSVAPERRLKATIREVAASTDPATRTYRVRATLLEGREITRLGMTATLWLPPPISSNLAIPRSAVFAPHEQPLQAKVWLLDTAAMTVHSIPVVLGQPLADQRIEASGLTPGQRIVTAGVHRLKEGQTVSLTKQGDQS
ncbi:MAG: efflux RND transporter periplasmic adaptor subunit [Methylococcales bacterium]|nr:efflux RND transporter periplasmic adaptor subunit [Methylococcales bacterium]